MIYRSIPGSKEKIPVIGYGTWNRHDVEKTDSAFNPLLEILEENV